MSAPDQLARTPVADQDVPGFVDVVRFEWTKFLTVRSTVALTAALGAVLPLLAVVVAATGSLQPDDTVLGASVLAGAVLAQILAGALGATVMTSEIRTGTIRSTLLACPRPLRLMAAKSVVVAAVAGGVCLPSSVAAFTIGSVLLDGDGYATGNAFPALGGVALAIAAIGVLGVAIGTIVRSSAGAVAGVVAVVLLPGMLAPLLGGAERWLGGSSMNGVLSKLVQSSDATHQAVGSLGAWPSLAVVGLYTVASVGLAVWILGRRDS